MSDRDVVFISHATPDDNEFVRWLGTRLTGYGYKVWADIFDLAGGTPFWGSIEPWYSETKDAFHLDQDQAAKLMEMIVRSYKDIHGAAPTELFIHGKTNFDPNEWAGFASAVPHTTKLVGVQIRDMADLKLFRYGANAVLRGTAVVTSETSGYLWTRGYIPRLRTYPGREVPNPLTVEIRQGTADIEQVMKDVMSLTKLNFNAWQVRISENSFSWT
jgi:hypothetical protein